MMSKINILIVEDEIIVYLHLERTLKSLGFKNVYTARSSTEALEIASVKKIDLLFSDIKIEGEVDGIDTAHILQKLYNIPVIFLTAFKDEEMLERASKIDVMRYLIKPYRKDEIEALIKLVIIKYKLGLDDRLIIDENYSFDKKEKKLFFKNKEINLTKKENIFISILIENINSFVSYELLETLIWYDEVVVDSTKRTFYSRVRQKLSDLNFKTQRASGIGLFTKN